MADTSLRDGPLHGLRNWLRQLMGPRNGETSLREELEELIEEHEEEEPIDPHERTLLTNILKLHELNAADIMVPRVDILALEIDTPFAEAVKQMVEHGHSRLPVYRETLDDVVGIVHIKDLLPYAADGKPAALSKLVRKVLFVAPSLPVLDLLLQMRQQRTHLALVIDEYGGVDGLVGLGRDVLGPAAEGGVLPLLAGRDGRRGDQDRELQAGQLFGGERGDPAALAVRVEADLARVDARLGHQEPRRGHRVGGLDADAERRGQVAGVHTR